MEEAVSRRRHTVLRRWKGTWEHRPDSLESEQNRIYWYSLCSTELQEFSSIWYHPSVQGRADQSGKRVGVSGRTDAVHDACPPPRLTCTFVTLLCSRREVVMFTHALSLVQHRITAP